MKYSTETFIEAARKVHGDKYDYSKVEYTNSQTKVCIICPEHGEFWQMPSIHLQGRGCLKCKYENSKLTNEEFIKRAVEIHGDKYDYSKVEYIDSNTKVCIICPKHGEFYVNPSQHINKGKTNQRGCPMCGEKNRRDNTRKTTEWFIEMSRKVHGDKYDYSNVIYERTDKDVCIICPEHGEFWQTPNRHLHNHGCPECGGNVKLTTDEFVKRSKKIHGDRYDYSKVDFKSTNKKVCIICPKHGEFWQLASGHLQGRGCPHCRQSSLEKEIRDFLEKENIVFIAQKRGKWLGKQSLDFYLPDYNIAIECQGGQHFKPFDYFGGNERYLRTRELDINKNKICKEHGIEIFYYTHCEEEYMFELITDLETLKNRIYAKDRHLSKNQYFVQTVQEPWQG